MAGLLGLKYKLPARLCRPCTKKEDVFMLTRIGIPVLAGAAVVFAAISVNRLRPVESKVEPFLPPPSASFNGKVGAVGIVEASSENIAVSLPVPGMVTAVYVKAGDRVTKGQRLFSLDDRDVRAELALR